MSGACSRVGVEMGRKLHRPQNHIPQALDSIPSVLPLLSSGLDRFRLKDKIVAQSCPTLCDPLDCSQPGSSLHGILQARILEWVIIPLSKDSSQSRYLTRVFALQVDSLPTEPLGKLLYSKYLTNISILYFYNM